jgi:hypothetical protein
MNKVIRLNSSFDALDYLLLKQWPDSSLLNEWCLFHLTFEVQLTWPQIGTLDQLRIFCSSHFFSIVIGETIYLPQVHNRRGTFTRYVDICLVLEVLGADQALVDVLEESNSKLLDPNGTHEMKNQCLDWRDAAECIESQGYTLLPLVSSCEHSLKSTIANYRLSGLTVAEEMKDLLELMSAGALTTEQALSKLGIQAYSSKELERIRRLQNTVWQQAEQLRDVLHITMKDFERLLLVSPDTHLMPARIESYIQLSYLLKIYKSLHCIFLNEEQANTWLHRANDHFDGQTALGFMLNDPTQAVKGVSEYLRTQLH